VASWDSSDPTLAPPSNARDNVTNVREDEITRWRQFVTTRWAPVVFIVLAVLAGNAFYLLGVTNADPISWTSGITQNSCLLSCGRSSIDINVGTITQPLGHLAAIDLWHGHWPWWNPFEGLGQPLAGEMQSAALFPLTALLIMPAGLPWIHVLLETVAGLSTYFLVRRLELNRVTAIAAGVLFALCGTFAWLANAVVDPLAFLPMLLLGIEIVLDRSAERTRRGLVLAAVALALSLYAGFPEVAYFDGLFCVGWTAVRIFSFPRDQRPRALRRLGFAGVVGVALSLPTLVPFLDFLRSAYVGGHVSKVDGSWALSLKAAPMYFDPYLYGSIYENHRLFTVWGEIGGYFGAGACALALVGLFGPYLRGLRIFMAAWIVAGSAGTFNILGTRHLWNLIPYANAASLPRYITPSCELAVALLAAFGVADLVSHHQGRQRLRRATWLFAVVLVGCAITGYYLDRGGVLQGIANWVLFVILNLVPVAATLTLLLIARSAPQARIQVLVVATLVVESLLWFIFPTLQAPSHFSVDQAPIQYLQQHQGDERFVDLAVLYPNWGTQFQAFALNAIDLPFPKNFELFIQRQLYPGLHPRSAFTYDGPKNVVAQEQELAQHLHAYEDASVKYVLAPRSLQLLPSLKRAGLRAVFHDAHVTIYELPTTEPFFSVTRGCEVRSNTVDEVTVNCKRAGAALTRRELYMQGWSASVNGVALKISSVDSVFQRVALPQGLSIVRYYYFPPDEVPALALALVAALLLVVGAFADLRTRRSSVAE
jgi:hypothetical protein